jgi:hypothetical protein
MEARLRPLAGREPVPGANSVFLRLLLGGKAIRNRALRVVELVARLADDKSFIPAVDFDGLDTEFGPAANGAASQSAHALILDDRLNRT